jgi:ribA/ribD-fused uncharacterized protein
MSSENSSSSSSGATDINRTYERALVVVVYKTKDDFGGLSNMAAGFPLRINGVRVPTSEALYQACRYPNHPSAQQEIIGQFSPMTAKMKAKTFKSQTRDDWDDVRFKIMRWCLRVKLNQNFAEFGRLLLATKERAIVEQSRRDTYWGAKLSEDGTCLVGQNVLGRLLMELREKLLTHGEAAFEVVEPLAIPDFLFLGRPIEPVAAHRGPSRRQDALFD